MNWSRAFGGHPDAAPVALVDALAPAHEARADARAEQLRRARADAVDHVSGPQHGVPRLGEAVGVEAVGAAHHEVGTAQPRGVRADAGVLLDRRLGSTGGGSWATAGPPTTAAAAQQRTIRRAPRTRGVVATTLNGMRVLAIDGGGIRGLIPALVLTELERRAGRRVFEMFDLIAGTSTGGILACALCAPDPLPASELVSLYEDEGPKIFDRSLFQRIRSAEGCSTRSTTTPPSTALSSASWDTSGSPRRAPI